MTQALVPEADGSGPNLTEPEIHSLAVRGSVSLVVRGTILRVLGFVGSLIIARILSPAEFGTIAFGQTLVNFVAVVSGLGLGAALIQRKAEPLLRELAALQFFQLLMAMVLVAAIAVAALFVGRSGWVALTMVLSLPLTLLQVPGAISLERQLKFRQRVLVEVAESIAYLLWSVGMVLSGAGVFGLASAFPVRSAVGLVTMSMLSPVGFVRPKRDPLLVRPLLRFGLKVQGLNVVNLGRDEGINLFAVGVGGLAGLGIWSLAFRVLQLPTLLFETGWRMGFPAMARLSDAPR